MNVLITGGAGFIGSRLAQHLARNGDVVTVLDNLSPQIHGPDSAFSAELRTAAHCVKGDICDAGLLKTLLPNQEVIVHLAAETGTGQSMYAIERYSRVNIQGTAILLDEIVNDRRKNLRKLVVASSRAVYGEGEYRCRTHGRVFPPPRAEADLIIGHFEPLCPICGEDVTPLATTEDAPLRPSSFYGLTKQAQEQMILMFAGALGIDGFALRYQNVYGPGQSLTNPYTGLLAIFSNLARQSQNLNIFEDGKESRDFVYVDDVIAATASCIASEVHGLTALNVGSGVRTAVIDVANAIVAHFGADVPVQVSGAFRIGDIRHNFADISRISKLTGFAPVWSFSDGLKAFLDWVSQFAPSDTGFEQSLSELRERGLMQNGPSRDQG